MKKILLSLLGVLIALPALARDFTYEYNGQTLTYTVIDEDEKTCCPKAGSYNWFQYAGIPGNNVSGDLVIPEFAVNNSTSYKVVKISEFSFCGCNDLVSVEIPKSVTKIGDSAFRECRALKSVSIPNSVTAIEDNVFRECSSLTSISIPESVVSIGNKVFDKCNGLTKAEFASVESLCDIKFAFYDANPLYYAHNLWIAGIEIKDLIIPESVTNIGDYTFTSCSGLSSASISNSVTAIGNSAFDECSGLIAVSIPGSVTEIGERAFYGCSGLTTVSIPGSVTEFGKDAFFGCSGLTSVYYLAEHPVEFTHASMFDSNTYNKATLYIFKEAFSTCKYIDPWRRFLKISEYINDFTYEYNGQTLTDTVIDEEAKTCRTKAGYFDDDNDMFFAGNNISGDLVIPEFAINGTKSYKVVKISDFSFNECSNLTSVEIPKSVSTIGEVAFFGCSNLKSAILPEAVTTIGVQAFRGCGRLESVTIPKSVTSIGHYTFNECPGLTSVYYLADNPIQSYDNIFDATTYNKATLYVLENAIPQFQGINPWRNFKNIIAYSVEHEFTYEYNGQTLTYTVIDEEAKTCRTKAGSYDDVLYIGEPGNKISGALEIPEFAFNNGIGYKVVEIPEYSFYNCSNLTSVTIPESVNTIGNSAFYGCTKLTKAEFASIESLCNIQFVDRYSNPLNYAHNLWIAGTEINNLIIPESVTAIGDYAFTYSGLTSVTIPESVTSIGECAFIDSWRLTSVTIPESCISIGEGAFTFCTGLTSVAIPKSITLIGHSAFAKCSNLTSIYYLADNPILSYSDIFEITTYNKAVLYVPENAIPLFQSIDPWRYFTNIIAYSGERDFTYEYNGQTLTYTVIDEEAKICRTKAGYFDSREYRAVPGNDVIGQLTIPEFALDGTIPYKVVEISDFSFSMCSGLISVELPYSVTKIGHSAFRECINLTSVTIPESTVSIGDWAFFGAIRLASIELPNSITEIGNAAFRECIGLTSIEIPKYVTFIGAAAFLECMGLTSVYYLADNPIEGNQDIFDENIYNTVKLYVLDDAFSRCLEINPWKNFLNIDVYYSGIEDITIDNDAPCEVYNLRGVHVADSIENLSAGIYIVRQGNNAKKIVVG